MALFSQNMLELAIELAASDPTYEDFVFKFVEHFHYIAAAMNRPGAEGMWDEDDGFYYDILRLPDGSATRLKVRSLVGLLPLCATTVIEKWQRELIPRGMSAIAERLRRGVRAALVHAAAHVRIERQPLIADEKLSRLQRRRLRLFHAEIRGTCSRRRAACKNDASVGSHVNSSDAAISTLKRRRRQRGSGR